MGLIGFSIDELLWWIATALNFLFAILLYPRAKSTKVSWKMNYFLGVVLFFVIHGTCRIPYIFYDYYTPGNFPKSIDVQWMWNLGALLGIISITVLIFFIENIIIKKTHHFFTLYGIAGVATFIIMINLPDPTVFKGAWQTCFVTPLALIVPLFYLVFAKQTTGSVRNNSLLMFIGIFIFEISQVAHSEFIWKAFSYIAFWILVFQLVGSILMIVGIAIVYISVSRTSF